MEEHIRSIIEGLGYSADWGVLSREATLPWVGLLRVSGFESTTLDGPSGFTSGRIQVDCYARYYDDAMTMRRAIKGALSGYRGGPVWSCQLSAIRDLSEGEGDRRIQRLSLDFAVQVRE